jgi:hypothetical protein
MSKSAGARLEFASAAILRFVTLNPASREDAAMPALSLRFVSSIILIDGSSTSSLRRRANA